MVGTRMKNKVGTSVINVKINADNEIEYLEVDEVADSDVEDDDDNEEDDDLDIEDPELVPNQDGSMTIKMPEKKKTKTIVEHVCGKCSRTYSTYAVWMAYSYNICDTLCD